MIRQLLQVSAGSVKKAPSVIDHDDIPVVDRTDHPGGTHMSTITVKDGTTIYYKDWGKGPVVTLSHGWPLSSDAWDGQMLFLAQNGFRVVAHDRRGHGRSSQATVGNE